MPPVMTPCATPGCPNTFMRHQVTRTLCDECREAKNRASRKASAAARDRRARERSAYLTGQSPILDFMGPAKPCSARTPALQGTWAKVLVLTARAERGEELWHEEDGQ